MRGLLEARTYHFTIPGATEIFIDDLPLQRTGTRGSFEWTPGFFAGRVSALINADGAAHHMFELDVGPSPDKLGDDEFNEMVEALSKKWPALLLGNIGEAGSFGAQGEHASPEVSYLRLKKALPEFFSSMTKVCATPILRLREERHAVLPHQAKRMDRTTVRELARTHYGVQLLSRDPNISAAPSPVSTPFTALTVDNPPNRYIAARIDALVAAIDRLTRTWATSVNGSGDQQLALRLPRRLELLHQARGRLSSMRRAEPFSSIAASSVTAAGLNAVAAHPDYARANQAAWKALRQGIQGTSVEALPFSPTWQVYERWCFMRISEFLISHFPDGGWNRRSQMALIGTIDHAEVCLRLQPTFQAWDNRGSGEFRSLSRQREPDIVLTHQSGDSARFLVLDAKYRVSRDNVLDAMSSAHIYQDSLRWKGAPPAASYLLLPRDGDVAWLRDPAFREEHRVGTFALSPTCQDSKVWSEISKFLSGSIAR